MFVKGALLVSASGFASNSAKQAGGDHVVMVWVHRMAISGTGSCRLSMVALCDADCDSVVGREVAQSWPTVPQK